MNATMFKTGVISNSSYSKVTGSEIEFPVTGAFATVSRRREDVVDDAEDSDMVCRSGTYLSMFALSLAPLGFFVHYWSDTSSMFSASSVPAFNHTMIGIAFFGLFLIVTLGLVTFLCCNAFSGRRAGSDMCTRTFVFVLMLSLSLGALVVFLHYWRELAKVPISVTWPSVSIEPDLSVSEIERLRGHADVNGDGRLSFPEFKAMSASAASLNGNTLHAGSRDEQNLAIVFSDLDSDADGQLSEHESKLLELLVQGGGIRISERGVLHRSLNHMCVAFLSLLVIEILNMTFVLCCVLWKRDLEGGYDDGDDGYGSNRTVMFYEEDTEPSCWYTTCGWFIFAVLLLLLITGIALLVFFLLDAQRR
eukprot:TRINITY_DN15689_c0_g1_i1.p1 TRINITY_DN15689_c0_g1~~TRINITY_DN15689_c0_g1_i1.p1  ORF type:complete len:373 (-),score=45.61 TRINITY_DN15689_c0_g1_i1:137-1225(-)